MTHSGGGIGALRPELMTREDFLGARRVLAVGDDVMDMAAGSWPVTCEAELAACYDATFDTLFGYAARLTGDRTRAEDLVSEAYLALVGAARAREVTEIGVGWLITTLRRRFIDGLRAASRERHRVRLATSRVGELTPGAESGGFGDVLGMLSDRERAAVVVLRYLDDLPVAEVARQLSTTVRSTESLLARARARVRATEVRDG
jgi:RNA polymerase sigma factor (sigma-70 family)